MNNSAEAEKCPFNNTVCGGDSRCYCYIPSHEPENYSVCEIEPVKFPYNQFEEMEKYAQASKTELIAVFKEAIYELWMYSGGEDQSSEIRKKLEKYHEITGMPWPEGELRYKNREL